MKIGINGYEAVVPRFGYSLINSLPNRVGSGQFAFELLSQLHTIDKENDYEIFLPKTPSSDMPKETKNWRYKVIPSRKLWTVTGLVPHFLAGKSKLDVFFTPGHYLPPFSPKNSVITILDVSYIHFPKLFKKRDLIQLNNWSRYSIRKAKKVITISKSSKNDIIKTYGVPENKVEVIYPGLKTRKQDESSNMTDLKAKFGIGNEYILFVGTLQPRKNIVRLIEAFSKLNTAQDLIIVGKKGWQYEEILDAPRKFGVSERVKFLDSVTDDDLPSLYKNAKLFILPSLYEGFGLPVLEAMSYGCPVITSNISSLPEAGGDAALYVDPEDTEDIANKMEKLLTDDKLREELIKKGYEQVKKFSWEKTAKETLGVLKQIANE